MRDSRKSDSELPSLTRDNRYQGLSLSISDSNLTFPRHRWYRFRQGFSKCLVDTAIDAAAAVRRNPRVLDPFAGAGTTLVCSLERGLDTVALEVNPFLAFVAETKTVPGPWCSAAFGEARSLIVAASPTEGISELEDFSTFSKGHGRDKWLFNTGVLRQFTACKRRLNAVPAEFRKPLLLSLLVAALETSNVSRDGKCLRYRRDWPTSALGSDDFRRAFEHHSSMVLGDLEALPLTGAGGVLRCGDARQLLRDLGEASCDLVVTSPPYLNSLDYTDVYRPELFLGGFVSSAQELRDLRLLTIRSHVQVSWKKTQEYQSAELNRVVEAVRLRELWDRRLPDMIQAYFDDLLAVMSELFRVLAPRGKVWLVVGTSAYANVHVPVDLLLGELAEKVGFELEGVFFLRNMRSSGQHWHQQETKQPPLRESLVILKRP